MRVKQIQAWTAGDYTGQFLRNRGPVGTLEDWLGLTTAPKPSHELTPYKLPIGYAPVTWGELIRRLQAAGFVEQRHPNVSHRQFVHPDAGRVAMPFFQGHSSWPLRVSTRLSHGRSWFQLAMFWSTICNLLIFRRLPSDPNLRVEPTASLKPSSC